MNIKSILAATVAALALVAFAPASQASDFEFEANAEGDASGEWNFEVSKTYDWDVRSGAEFSFNGGAGTDGEAIAKGEYTGVGGLFGEYAYGGGNAYSDTFGDNYADAEFHSGAGAINGGFAADASFSGDPSKIVHSGIVTAGGAGSAETGLTFGFGSKYTEVGSFSGNYEFNNSGSYED